MTDLDTVMEDSPVERPSPEIRHSRSRMNLSRNSILMTNSGFHIGMTNSGYNSNTGTRRQSSRTSSFRSGYDRRFIRYENTYRLEPDDEHQLDLVRIRRLATRIIETTILAYSYNSHQAKQFSMTLAERLRSELKYLPFPRYKFITLVSIGEKKGQALRITSRCLWDLKLDRHITITKETSDAFVTVTIFYVYAE